MTEVRLARVEEAERLAWVHLRAWQQAYAGLVPSTYLDSLMDQLPERTQRWREGPAASPAWVAVSEAGEVVGFAVFGPSRDEDVRTGATEEVGAIYVLAEHWGIGAGRRLMQAALASLRQAGFSEATLWVLDGNARARRFYEAGGWQLDGATKDDQREGFTLPEVRYQPRAVRDRRSGAARRVRR